MRLNQHRLSESYKAQEPSTLQMLAHCHSCFACRHPLMEQTINNEIRLIIGTKENANSSENTCYNKAGSYKKYSFKTLNIEGQNITDNDV